MDVQEKFGILVRYIRDSKRKIFSATLVASIISVILFIAGSYWLLFHYYESIVRDYYSSVLRDISIFQHELIGKDTYIEDLKGIATAVDQHKGVEHVWFTDRFGGLLYSTDSGLFEQYRKKRLPSNYFESIQWVWSFEGGYPKAHVVPIHRFFSLRFSIPIYAYGREDYDFVMGMDAKRVIYLPEKLSLLLPISIGYIVFFTALLFFPIFIWVNSRFSGVTTQAKILLGSMERTIGKSTVQEIREQQAVPEELVTSKAAVEEEEEKPQEPEKEETVKEEEVIEKARAEQKVKVKEKTPVDKKAEAVKEKVPKPQEIEPLALFLEKKKGIFMKEDAELPFIHASSFVHHSQKLGGSYIYTHRGKNTVYFTSFVFPYTEVYDALEHTDMMIAFLQQKMDNVATLLELSRELNSFCHENRIKLDLSIVSIHEANRTVQYSSFGSGYSLYVKHGEDQVKELELQIPRLGTVSNDEFEKSSSFADIRFVKDDIFVLLPQNAATVIIVGEPLVKIIKKEILSLKGQSARDIVINLSTPFKTARAIPQTGFVVFKFI